MLFKTVIVVGSAGRGAGSRGCSAKQGEAARSCVELEPRLAAVAPPGAFAGFLSQEPPGSAGGGPQPPPARLTLHDLGLSL